MFDAIRFHNGLAHLRGARAAGYPEARYSNFQVRLPNPIGLAERSHLQHVHGVSVTAPLTAPRIPNRSRTTASIAFDLVYAKLHARAEAAGMFQPNFSVFEGNAYLKSVGVTVAQLRDMYLTDFTAYLERLAHEFASLPRWQAEAAAIMTAQREARSLTSAMTPPTKPDARLKANVRALEVVKQAAADNRVLTPQERVEVLAYTGYGGLAKYFTTINGLYQLTPQFESLYPIPREYRPSEAETTYEYFTPILLCEAIERTIRPLLAKAENALGKIIALEPAAGTGRLVEPFFDVDVKWTLVEYNRAQSRLLQGLYPSAHVYGETPFEEFVTEYQEQLQGQYNLIVANPPYGEWYNRGLDREFASKAKQAEDYFLLRCLPLLARDGVAVFIVPSTIMSADAQKTVRRAMLEQWHLAAAVRLPMSVFDNVAIMIDVIICQGRGGKLNVPSEDQYIVDGQYFEQHPAHILGTFSEKGGRFGKGEVTGPATAAYEMEKHVKFRAIGAQTSYNAAKASTGAPLRKVTKEAAVVPTRPGASGKAKKFDNKALETDFTGARDRLVLTPLQRHVARACLLSEYVPHLERLSRGNAQEWEEGRTAHAELQHALQAVCRYCLRTPETMPLLQQLRSENVEGAIIFLDKILPVQSLFAYPARNGTDARDVSTIATQAYPLGGVVADMAASLQLPEDDLVRGLTASGWYLLPTSEALPTSTTLQLVPDLHFSTGDVGATYSLCAGLTRNTWAQKNLAALPRFEEMEWNEFYRFGSDSQASPTERELIASLTTSTKILRQRFAEEHLESEGKMRDDSYFNEKGFAQAVVDMEIELDAITSAFAECERRFPSQLQRSLDRSAELCGFEDVTPYLEYLEITSAYLSPRLMGAMVKAAQAELGGVELPGAVVLRVSLFTTPTKAQIVTPLFVNREEAYQWYRKHIEPRRNDDEALSGKLQRASASDQKKLLAKARTSRKGFMEAVQKDGVIIGESATDAFGQAIFRDNILIALERGKKDHFACGADWAVGEANDENTAITAQIAGNKARLRKFATARSEASDAVRQAFEIALQECPNMPTAAREYILTDFTASVSDAAQLLTEYNKLQSDDFDGSEQEEEAARKALDAAMAAFRMQLPTVLGPANIVTSLRQFRSDLDLVTTVAEPDGIWFAVSPLGNGVIGWPSRELSAFIEASIGGYDYGAVRYNASGAVTSQIEKAMRDSLNAVLGGDESAKMEIQHAMRCFASPYLRREPQNTVPGLTRWRGKVQLLPHQARGAWQTFYDVGALMAFDVGVGKTFCGTASIVQHRQYAAARKPIMLLPNPLTSKWCRDFANCTPDYAIAVIGDTFKLEVSALTGQLELESVDDTAEERAAKIRDFNEGLYDVLFMPRSVISRLQPSLETLYAFSERLRTESKQVVFAMEQSGASKSSGKDKKAEKPQAEPDANGRMWRVEPLYSRPHGYYGARATYDEAYVTTVKMPNGATQDAGLAFQKNAWHIFWGSEGMSVGKDQIEAINALNAVLKAGSTNSYLWRQAIVDAGVGLEFSGRASSKPTPGFLSTLGLGKKVGGVDEDDPKMYETWTIAIFYLLGIKVARRAQTMAKLVQGFAPIIHEDGRVEYSAVDKKLFEQALELQWQEHTAEEEANPTKKKRKASAEDDAEESDEDADSEMDEGDDDGPLTGLPWRRINISYEQLRPDLLVLDEAQAFKNLWFPRSFVGAQVRFLGSAQTSAQAAALDAWLSRTRQIAPCKVQLLSATPAKNSPIELYTMLAYISPGWLRSRGIPDVSTYANRFLQIGRTLYVKANGDIESNAKAVMSFNDLQALKSILFRFATFLDSDQAAKMLPDDAVDLRARFAKPRPNRINADIPLAPHEQMEIQALRAAIDETGNASKKIAVENDMVPFNSTLDRYAEKDGSNTMVILSQLPRVGAQPELSYVARPIYQGQLLFRPDVLEWEVTNHVRVNTKPTLKQLYSTDTLSVPTGQEKRALLSKSVAALSAHISRFGSLPKLPAAPGEPEQYDHAKIATLLIRSDAALPISCGWKLLPPLWWWSAVSDEERAYLLRGLSRWQLRGFGVGMNEGGNEEDDEGEEGEASVREQMQFDVPLKQGVIDLERDGGAYPMEIYEGTLGVVDVMANIDLRGTEAVDKLSRPAGRDAIQSWVKQDRISSAKAKYESLKKKQQQAEDANEKYEGPKLPATEDEYVRQMLSQAYFPLLPDGNKNTLRNTFMAAFEPSAGRNKAQMDFWQRMKYAPSTRIRTLVERVMGYDRSKAQIIFCLEKDMQVVIFWALVAAGFPRERIGIMNADTAPNASSKLGYANALNGVENQPNSAKLDLIIANSVAYEGIDLQVRTVAMHHFDLPWEPATLTQRNGRAWRQGNQNPQVDIIYYTAANSADGYRMQMLEGKSGWIADIVKSEAFALANVSADPNATRQQTFMSMCPDAEAAGRVMERFQATQRRQEEAEKRAAARREFGRACAIQADIRKYTARGAVDRLKVLRVSLEAALVALNGALQAGYLAEGLRSYVEALRTDQPVFMASVLNGTEKTNRPVMVGDVLQAGEWSWVCFRFKGDGNEGFGVWVRDDGAVRTNYCGQEYSMGMNVQRLNDDPNYVLKPMTRWLDPLKITWQARCLEARVAAQFIDYAEQYSGPLRTDARFADSNEYSLEDNWQLLTDCTNEQLAYVGWEDISRWQVKLAVADGDLHFGENKDGWYKGRQQWGELAQSLLRIALATETNEAGERVIVSKAQWEAAFKAFREKPEVLPPRMAALGDAAFWEKLQKESINGESNLAGLPSFIDSLRRFLRDGPPSKKDEDMGGGEEKRNLMFRTRPDSQGAIPVVVRATGQIGVWFPPSRQTGFSAYGLYKTRKLNLTPGYIVTGDLNVSLTDMSANVIPFLPQTEEEALAAITVLQPNSEGALIMLQSGIPWRQLVGYDGWFRRIFPWRGEKDFTPSPYW
jgi:hypothetical protein